MNVIPAMITGYQRPAWMLPVAAIADSPISGCKPPKTPFPIWYGSENDVYRIFAGKASTRKAAIGPATIEKKINWTNTRKMSIGRFGAGASGAGNNAPLASFVSGVRAIAPVTGFFWDRAVTT